MRLALLHLGQDRGGDEDRGVGAGQHADEQDQREVFQLPGPEDGAPDEQDAGHREQGDYRGVDGPDQGLVEREVGRLAVGAPGRAGQPCGVLPDLVENDHGVVKRVTEDGEQPDHGGRADLEAGQRVDPGRDHDVVDQRDERGRGHPPLERGRQVDDDHDQESDQRLQRFMGDLAAPGGPDRGDAHLRVGQPEGVAKAVLHLEEFRVGECPSLHLPRRFAAAADLLDD